MRRAPRKKSSWTKLAYSGAITIALLWIAITVYRLGNSHGRVVVGGESKVTKIDDDATNPAKKSERQVVRNASAKVVVPAPAPPAPVPAAKKVKQKAAVFDRLPFNRETGIKEPIREGKPPPHGCVHAPGRDYMKNPVVVLMPGATAKPERWKRCDIPCNFVVPGTPVTYWDLSVDRDGGHGGQGDRGPCAHGRKAVFSMESVAYYPGLGHEAAHQAGYDIVATYELDTDVPLPYFSWAEYPFERQPMPKRKDAMLAMVISNCGAPNGRLEYLKKLQDAGVTVHSYGSCMHNKDMPPTTTTDYGWQKLEVVAGYKFTAAMENTNTKDYVTEKLFGPLVVGTVPIHMGVKDVHDFAPDHSVISVHDFESPAALATFLKALDANDTAYEEYLEWKKKPFSPRFKAMLDISKVHSFCRLCIRTADMNRREFGPEARPGHLPDFSRHVLADQSLLPLWVRERGKFWPMPAVVKDRTIDALRSATLAALRPGNPPGVVAWAIYDRFDRSILITTDDDVKSLDRMTELEAIIVEL